MRIYTPVQDFANAYAHAVHSAEAFDDIEYESMTVVNRTPEKKKRRPGISDIEVYAMFKTLWGSTAMGFGGIGGAAITMAYTIILTDMRKYAVYYGGLFAYAIDRPNQTFFEDVKNRKIATVKDSKKYSD